jgi:alpha-N-acetylglucosaminidase
MVLCSAGLAGCSADDVRPSDASQTLWYPTTDASAQLRDYANREWAGLVKDVYAVRRKKYFASLDAALATDSEPALIDWYALESEWVQAQQEYGGEPVGEPHLVASSIAERLAEVIGQRIYELLKSGKCMEITGGNTDPGAKLQLWTCNGTEAQDFSLEDAEAGHHAVVNRKSGHCLEIEGGGTSPGASLIQNACEAAADRQSFSFN